MHNSEEEKYSFVRMLKELYRDRREYVLLIISLLAAIGIFIVLLNTFFDITENLDSEWVLNLDDRVTAYFYSLRTDTLTSFVIGVTNMGDKYAYFFLVPVSIAVLIALKKQWRVIIEAAMVLLSATLLNMGMKNYIDRPRPAVDKHLVEALSYSYPSGHAMSAMAFYGFIIFLTFMYIKPIWLKNLLIFLLIILIIGIGLSRIYLGVHYPSDVIAGWIAGLLWLLLCIAIFRIFRYLRIRHTHKSAE